MIHANQIGLRLKFVGAISLLALLPACKNTDEASQCLTYPS
ncbi:hypothetical protein VST7929_02581 [Vibrio stylophorae]|uniref:Uncharacterized protein n=1 Tax=Vibrio stylophorae TaxID=659351 RepID=A0ABN8DUB4_9VIBR|nr:hypothetical protein VST7929_02581 [Vibrio stylophorae]